MKNFTKVVRIGTVPCGYPEARYSAYAKIEVKDGRLSISGAIGPKANGDCHGSAGQWDMSFKEYGKHGHLTLDDVQPAPGWDAAMVKRFLDTWSRWHLNDMSPMCSHQRAQGWRDLARREVTIYGFELNEPTRREQDNAKKQAMAALKKGETFTPTAEQTLLVNLEYWVKWHEPTLPEKLAPYYQPSTSTYTPAKETKTLGWLYEKDHPDGLLCKPCPDCGYKYGSAWQSEEVPSEVLEWLQALPDTDTKPAWV